MRTVLVVIGAAAVIVGGIWIGQGAGLIPGSFMTGSQLWFVIGLVLAVVGVGLAVAGLRGMRRRDRCRHGTRERFPARAKTGPG